MATSEEIISVELPAPSGWKKKFTPKKGRTPGRGDVVFIAPNGEEIKNKRQLDKYLKTRSDCPPSSEFDWTTGDTPRRSARISEKVKATESPEDEKPKKRGRTRKKQETEKEEEEEDIKKEKGGEAEEETEKEKGGEAEEETEKEKDGEDEESEEQEKDGKPKEDTKKDEVGKTEEGEGIDKDDKTTDETEEKEKDEPNEEKAGGELEEEDKNELAPDTEMKEAQPAKEGDKKNTDESAEPGTEIPDPIIELAPDADTEMKDAESAKAHEIQDPATETTECGTEILEPASVSEQKLGEIAQENNETKPEETVKEASVAPPHEGSDINQNSH